MAPIIWIVCHMKKLKDMHISNGSANGIARMTTKLNDERFPSRYMPGYRMFTSLHQRLHDTDGFSVNKMVAGRPGWINVENEQEIPQHFRENPWTNIENKTLQSMVNLSVTTNNTLTISDGAGAAPNRLNYQGNWRRFFKVTALYIQNLFYAWWCVHNLHMWQNDNTQVEHQSHPNTGLVRVLTI